MTIVERVREVRTIEKLHMNRLHRAMRPRPDDVAVRGVNRTLEDAVEDRVAPYRQVVIETGEPLTRRHHHDAEHHLHRLQPDNSVIETTDRRRIHLRPNHRRLLNDCTPNARVRVARDHVRLNRVDVQAVNAITVATVMISTGRNHPLCVHHRR